MRHRAMDVKLALNGLDSAAIAMFLIGLNLLVN